MKKILYPLIALVFLAVAGITFLLIAAPTDLIRDQIVTLVKQKTGRDLTINGETSFSVFPSLGLTVKNVTLSGPASNPGRHLLKMDRLTANVSLLPLIQQKIEVNSFILDRPRFDLWVDRNGVSSWEFAAGQNDPDIKHARSGNEPRLIRVANEQPLPAVLEEFKRNSGGSEAMKSADRIEGLLKDLSLEKVSVNQGAFRYEDQRSGSNHFIEGIDLRLGLSDLENPLDAEGGFLWQRQRVSFDGRLASPKRVLSGQTSDLVLNIGGKNLTAKFDGSIAVLDKFMAKGKLSANTQAMDGLIGWLAAGAGQNLGGAASLQSQVSADQAGARFQNIKFALRGVKGGGDVSINTSGARPDLRGELNFALLDISQLMSGPTSGGAARNNAAISGGGDTSRGGKSDLETNNPVSHVAQGAPGRPGNSQSAGWSRAPIDVTALNGFNAQLVANVALLKHGNVKVTNSRLVTLLNNGLLRVNMEKASLYGGRGTGRLSIDGARQAPKLSGSMLINNVSALPLLKDAADFGWIDGKGQISIKIAGQGRSQEEIIGSLSGDGRVTFNDGAIVGVNIPKMVRSFQGGGSGDGAKDDTQRTDFSELSGTFTIARGVATNKDLRLVGPLLRMEGTGTIDIPRESIDYSLKPKLVASLDGQGAGGGGAAGALGGIEIPLRVSGPWSSPSIVPDLTGLMTDPNRAVESAKKIFKGFKKQMEGGGGGVGDIMKGFFGGGNKQQ